MLTYDVFAEFYDHYKGSDDYDKYMGQYIAIAKENGFVGEVILDLGCGTGTSMLPLLKKGFKVDGLDISQSMLTVAQEKLKSFETKLIQGDIRKYSSDKKYDMVLSVDDVLNHVTDEEGLSECFKHTYDVLNNQGIFIFDLNTSPTFSKYFDLTHVYEEDETTYIWNAKYKENEGRAELTAFIKRDESYCKRQCVIEERYYSKNQVERLLMENGFSLIDAYGYKDQMFHPKLEETEDLKMLLVAQKI